MSALLSVINLSGEQLRLLALLGLDKDSVFDAMTATILYQDLFRSNLRVPDGIAMVECIVPDLPSAMALAAELPGCTLVQMPEHAIPELAERRHGPAPSCHRMSDAERQRKSRATKRNRTEQARQRAREDA